MIQPTDDPKPWRPYPSAILRCPQCGDEWTHVDEVRIAARGEDAPFTHIRVDAQSRRVETHCQDPAPTGIEVGDGRRHRIALMGWCETCRGTWALVFTQHKGITFVEVAQP